MRRGCEEGCWRYPGRSPRVARDAGHHNRRVDATGRAETPGRAAEKSAEAIVPAGSARRERPNAKPRRSTDVLAGVATIAANPGTGLDGKVRESSPTTSSESGATLRRRPRPRLTPPRRACGSASSTAASGTRSEPPGADPHARWYGRGRGEPGPSPIDVSVRGRRHRRTRRSAIAPRLVGPWPGIPGPRV
jgi:hypothetical protein